MARKRYSRKNIMQALSKKLDLSFEENGTKNVMPYMEDFKLFQKGRNKKILNVMRQTDEWMETDLRIFDYHYTTGIGNMRKEHKQTVFFVNSKAMWLPKILIRPEWLIHQLAKFLGMQDINFVDYPKFSHQYLVQGDDEELIRYVMNEKVLQFFTFEKNWYMEGLNYYLVLYHDRQLLRTQSLEAFYNKGIKLYEMFKVEEQESVNASNADTDAAKKTSNKKKKTKK